MTSGSSGRAWSMPRPPSGREPRAANHHCVDEVSFELSPAGEDFSEGLKQIKIEVNGTELPELVRDVELPGARAEGDEELAGNYVGLVPGYVRMDVAGHFLAGAGAKLYDTDDEKVQLLGCGCGEIGCSPLLARVTVT